MVTLEGCKDIGIFKVNKWLVFFGLLTLKKHELLNSIRKASNPNEEVSKRGID